MAWIPSTFEMILFYTIINGNKVLNGQSVELYKVQQIQCFADA